MYEMLEPLNAIKMKLESTKGTHPSKGEYNPYSHTLEKAHVKILELKTVDVTFRKVKEMQQIRGGNFYLHLTITSGNENLLWQLVGEFVKGENAGFKLLASEEIPKWTLPSFNISSDVEVSVTAYDLLDVNRITKEKASIIQQEIQFAANRNLKREEEMEHSVREHARDQEMIQSMRRTHAKAIGDAVTDARKDEAAKWKQHFDEEIANQQQKHGDEMTQLVTLHGMEMAQAICNTERNEEDRWNQRLDQEMENLQNQNCAEIESLKEEHEIQLYGLQIELQHQEKYHKHQLNELQEEIRTLREQHELKVVHLREAHEFTLKVHSEPLELERQQYEEKIQEALDSQQEELQQQHKSEMGKLRRDYEREIQSARQRITSQDLKLTVHNVTVNFRETPPRPPVTVPTGSNSQHFASGKEWVLGQREWILNGGSSIGTVIVMIVMFCMVCCVQKKKRRRGLERQTRSAILLASNLTDQQNEKSTNQTVLSQSNEGQKRVVRVENEQCIGMESKEVPLKIILHNIAPVGEGIIAVVQNAKAANDMLMDDILNDMNDEIKGIEISVSGEPM